MPLPGPPDPRLLAAGQSPLLQDEEGPSSQITDAPAQSRDQLEEYCERLQVFVEDAKQDLLSGLLAVRLPNIPQEVIIDVQTWLSEPSRSFLWVEGSGHHQFDQVLSSLALHISDSAMKRRLNSAMERRLDVITFFGKDQYTFEAQVGSSDVAGLVALLYSLICQLVLLAPATFEANLRLAASSFDLLDGSKDSIPHALEVVDGLLDLAPTGLMCILDGLERMESRDTVRHLSTLISLLRRHGESKRLKVLFTTSGSCVVLEHCMDDEERCDASRLAQVRDGSPLPGGMSLNDISFW
ncbi:hypothetical protein F4778DRAFT_783830 [Xylariomycetidae sp. FL2044]|nr:hypothetical protein F4778DRAFT_783830 [Xylariomycetidae sp. FL2044]